MSPRLALLAGAVLVACVHVHTPDLPPLRIGVPADYPPFAEARGDTFAGLDVDVARRFAADSGRRLELVAFRWPDLIPDLLAGRFDVAMGGITMRPERVLVASFTRPVLETGAIVLARSGVDDVDRASVRLGVNRGGHLERLARRLFPHAALQPTADNRDLAGLLARGEVDALLTDDVEAAVLSPQLPITHRIGPLTRDRKAYLGRDAALIAALDGWLRAREIDGTLDVVRERWLGADHRLGLTAFESDLSALLALIDLRLALMPSVAAAKERAGRPLEDPAREARVLDTARTQAAALRLDVPAAEALVWAQVVAARAVQRAYLATPPARRSPVEPVDLERDARPALERISAAILARGAALCRDGAALARLDPARITGGLDPALDPGDRREIARAVLRLRPNPAKVD